MEFQAVSNGATRRRVIRYNTCTNAFDFKFWLCLWFWVFTAFVNILPPFGVNICSPSPSCIPLALWEKLTFYICIHVFYNSPFRFQKIHAVYCCMESLTWSNFTSVKLCFASIYNTEKGTILQCKGSKRCDMRVTNSTSVCFHDIKHCDLLLKCFKH